MAGVNGIGGGGVPHTDRARAAQFQQIQKRQNAQVSHLAQNYAHPPFHSSGEVRSHASLFTGDFTHIQPRDAKRSGSSNPGTLLDSHAHRYLKPQ